MKIQVIGLGYMGLPTACLLANAGFDIIGMDIDEKKIEDLKKGTYKTDEPQVLEILSKAKNNGIVFSTKVELADVFIISVPTPAEQGKCDISFVEAATRSVVDVLKDGDLVIVESSVAPGTCDGPIKKILDNSGKKYLLAHCPERAIPGATVREQVENNRVIGASGSEARKKTVGIYSKFVTGEIHETDLRTAETVKIFENTYRSINIAYANEIAQMAKSLGINPWTAIELANKHPRVNIHNPGPGVGGHCIPVDPWFLLAGYPKSKIIKTALEINESMPKYVISEVAKHISGAVTVAVLGVAYKADVDDAREAPAFHIISEIKKRGWKVLVVDPHVNSPEINTVPLEEALEEADVAVLVTDHTEFKEADFKDYPIKLFFDTRNAIAKKQLNKNTKYLTFGD